MPKEADAKLPRKKTGGKDKTLPATQNAATAATQSPLPHNAKKEALGPNTQR